MLGKRVMLRRGSGLQLTSHYLPHKDLVSVGDGAVARVEHAEKLHDPVSLLLNDGMLLNHDGAGESAPGLESKRGQ